MYVHFYFTGSHLSFPIFLEILEFLHFETKSGPRSGNSIVPHTAPPLAPVTHPPTEYPPTPTQELHVLPIEDLFTSIPTNFEMSHKIKGRVKKILNVQRHMSLPRPNEPYHFQANLVWCDSPFKCQTQTWGGNFCHRDAKPHPIQSHAVARLPYVHDDNPTPSPYCYLAYRLEPTGICVTWTSKRWPPTYIHFHLGTFWGPAVMQSSIYILELNNSMDFTKVELYRLHPQHIHFTT